jgi:hypothetical protein
MPKQTTNKKTATKPNQVFSRVQQRTQRYFQKRPHRSFKLTPRSKLNPANIIKVRELVLGSFNLLWQKRWLLGGLAVLYAVLGYLFLGGVSQQGFLELRQAAQGLFTGNLGQFGTVTALFSSAITGGLSPATDQLQQFIGLILTLVFWLATVWILRRHYADTKTSIREALYNCCGPLIPVAIILLFIMIQLVPALLGVFLAAVVQSGAWLQGGAESMLITAAAGLLCLLTLYWVTGSVMAFVASSLPGMYPWQAVSVGSELVVGRRWQVALRLVILAVILVVGWAVIFIPTLLIDGWLRLDWLPLVPVVVQLLGALTLVYSSVYIYKIYRSLL